MTKSKLALAGPGLVRAESVQKIERGVDVDGFHRIRGCGLGGRKLVEKIQPLGGCRRGGHDLGQRHRDAAEEIVARIRPGVLVPDGDLEIAVVGAGAVLRGGCEVERKSLVPFWCQLILDDLRGKEKKKKEGAGTRIGLRTSAQPANQAANCRFFGGG